MMNEEKTTQRGKAMRQEVKQWQRRIKFREGPANLRVLAEVLYGSHFISCICLPV